jgi:MFS family permease
LAAPIGLLCANAVFALVIWSIFEEAFFSWGWRIPFLLSIILVGVAAAKLRLATSLDESGAGRRAEGLSDALASLWRCSLERKLQQHIATKNSLENSAD